MANIMLVGYAYQKGLMPLSAEAILEAIRLNGVAIEANTQAFRWGRLLAVGEAPIAALAAKLVQPVAGEALSLTLEEAIARREQFLTDYQDAAYAERYRARVEAVRALEARVMPGRDALSWAVAKYLFKLMAYKDEYEVARLYTGGSFRQQLDRTFEGDYRLEFHLAPPVLSRPDPATGRPRKVSFGPWMMRLFGVLAKMKRLRGTRLDPFGYSGDRKMERRLLADYEALLDEIALSLRPDVHETAVALASLPEQIRGYGPVKAAAVERAKLREAELLEALRRAPGERQRAA
jgi:indolepyruvate ferredoxin oxidoreductase